jgi:arginine decarboxylase
MGRVLGLVQYSENELNRRMKVLFDRAIKQHRLRPSEAMRLLKGYEQGLKGYTYLDLLKGDKS